jgi:archaellum component FlaC
LRLKERTQDIETWREKLQRELNYLTTENEKLIKSRDELDHAIVQLKRPEVVYSGKCTGCHI